METRICQNCHHTFVIDRDDFSFYEKIKVPPPTWCPECRMIRRFLFRNERFLFRREDSRTGQEIFSSFPASAPVTVYERDYWWSDQWDSMDYGREYDFSRPFFEQFRELLSAVPVPSKSVVGAVNADYCDQVGWIKNSYLCFDADYIENCAYLVKGSNTKDSMDVYEAMNDELCYETVMADENYRVFFSMDCEKCSEVWFSKDLVNCDHCFGCANLRNKSYHIFNQPYAKDEYFGKLKELNTGSYESIKKLRGKAQTFWLQFPVKYLHGYHNVNTTGEHIHHGKNVQQCYSVHDGENLKYAQLLWKGATDCYDYTNFGLDASQIYECVTCGFKSYGLKFCWECWDGCRDLEYSGFCVNSSNLFGCIGLRKKQYCIFNKQYPKEEYSVLREKIIQHMNDMPYTDARKRVYRYGEFFPLEFSPFAYNEALTQDFLPLVKEKAMMQGFRWHDSEAREYEITLDAVTLPDHIQDVHDAIVKEIIKCLSCGNAYRIIQMELDFLRNIGLPLPRLCPDCRFRERFTFVNPPKFWHAACQCAGNDDSRNIYKNTAKHFHGLSPCSNKFETSYASERSEIVYCELCYQQEVA